MVRSKMRNEKGNTAEKGIIGGGGGKREEVGFKM